MIIGKTPDIIKKLNLMIKEKLVEKYYLAIVLGKLEKKQGEIKTYLKRVKENFIDLSKIVDKEEDKAQLAITEYKVVKESNELSLVEVNLKTGRFHQIRAQLSLAGFPIVGDIKYGAKFPLIDRSIALCESSIAFKLATKNEMKKISILLPVDWSQYMR